MKKFITLFASIACLLLYTAVNVNAQVGWTPIGNHIYNPNNGPGGFVGIGTNAAPGKLLDVFRNTTEPTIRVFNTGGLGGATFQMTDAATNGDWKFKVIGGGHFKIRDQVNGLDVFFIEKNAAANAIYIKQGGNVGIGTNNPLEMLHVNGSVLIGNTANNNTGTIRWDGSNFQGYNGTGWVNLDVQNNCPWIVLPNVPLGNPELFSGPQPMSLSFALPGMPNAMARLYVTDISAPGLFPHQLALEAIAAGPGASSASQLYQISAAPMAPIINYSAGINNLDMTYKVNFGPVLTPTAQSDNVSMIRAFPSGIIDLPNQSRVRAYQLGAPVQMIPPSAWTPVNFNLEGPLPAGWDEQGEFTTALNPGVAVPPEMAYFTATQEGYYQVNARCQFELPTGPGPLGPGSFVSIAIWTGVPGATASYAIGNNLAISYLNAGQYYPLLNNNAPNVSDVVYLMPGQIIAIRVWQSSLGAALPLVQGANACYVSIHKVS